MNITKTGKTAKSLLC